MHPGVCSSAWPPDVTHLERVCAQQLLQQAPPAKDPALHRALRHTQNFRNLVVTHAFHITERNRFAELGWQRVQRADHFFIDQRFKEALLRIKRSVVKYIERSNGL